MTYVQIIDSWSLSQTSRVLASWILAFLALPLSSIKKTERGESHYRLNSLSFFSSDLVSRFPSEEDGRQVQNPSGNLLKATSTIRTWRRVSRSLSSSTNISSPRKKALLIVSGSLLLRFALVTWLTLPYEFMILTFRLCHCWLRFWKDLMRGARPNLQDESSRSKRSVWKSGEISVHVSQGTIRDHSGIEHKSIVL